MLIKIDEIFTERKRVRSFTVVLNYSTVLVVPLMELFIVMLGISKKKKQNFYFNVALIAFTHFVKYVRILWFL